MKAIGGYFELELRAGEHYHNDAIRLNTGRNCFEYILRARKYNKVFIPYYTCEVMLEPLHRLNIEYEFYHINEVLEPISKPSLKKDEVFLYTNYFGLKQDCVERLSIIYETQLIVDNAQAFYAPRIQGIDTFYSPRKFFGVSDGGYLYTDQYLDEEIEKDYSYDRMLHLLKRADVSAEFGFEDFHKNDSLLENNPIRKMSFLTEKILCSIDYDDIRKRRRENYLSLQEQLGSLNLLNLELNDSVPMVYPYLVKMNSLKQKLIENKIYVATYWPNVLDWCNKTDCEYQLTEQLLALPVDQRYTKEILATLINEINI